MLGCTLLGSLGCDLHPPPDVCDAFDDDDSPSTPTGTDGLDQATDWLSLSSSERRAIVHIAGTLLGDPSVCSGILVAPTTVLTALHCRPLVESDAAVLTLDDDGPLVVTSVVPHLGRDLLRIELAAAPIDVTPIGINLDLVSVDDISRHAALFGFSRASPRPFTAVEPIVDVTEAHIVVDSGPHRGACRGDSGGPLIWRNDVGAPVVIGILSEGATDCRGRDRFERIDTVDASWRAGLESSSTTTGGNLPCGGVRHSGQCREGRAHWCEDDVLRASVCARCGFDLDVGGFRCLAPPQVDPCGGATDLGQCLHGDVARCVDGTRAIDACSACGRACAIDPSNGAAVCQ